MHVTLHTDRLDIEPVTEEFRSAFIEFFTDPTFMVFSGGAEHTPASASDKYDHMMLIFEEVTFAKRPIVVRSTGQVVGYAGVDVFEHEGTRRYEFGWRLIESARGNGYATEAAQAVLEHAGEVWSGDILVMIAPNNAPSSNVARKIGSTFWKKVDFDDFLVDFYRLTV